MQKKILPILFGTLLIDMIGTGMIIPIIPILFTDPSSHAFLLQGYDTRAQFFIAGLITAIFGLMQFTAAPILGELSDAFGRKRLLMIGVGVLAIAQMLFGVGIEIGSIALLFISRAVAGIAGANLAIAQASIADITPPQDRAKNFGLIGAAFGIGFILGPLLGGWAASAANDAAAPFWLAAVLGLCNLAFVYFMLPETNHTRTIRQKFHILKGLQNIRAAFLDREGRFVFGASFFYYSGFAFFTSFSGVLLVNKHGFTESGIGSFFAYVGVMIVTTQLFILRVVTKKFTERQILRVTLLAIAVTLTLYPFMPTKSLLIALMPFLTIPVGLTMSNIGALVSKSVSKEKQGAALGINSSLLAFSQGVIPVVAGVASGFFALQAPFIAGSVFVLIAWSFLFIFGRHFAVGR